MSNPPKTSSLIISTYNWPEALRLVLESVKKQTQLPDEVLIADDGSGNNTRKLIEEIQKTFPCPLIHVWQEDDGFRRCQIWNKTISQIKSEYVIQIDGDCIISKTFVEDHIKFAREGFFSCGSRTLLTPKLSQKLLTGTQISLSPFTSGVQNKFNALRIPLLTILLRERYRAGKPYISKGCNMAFWLKDLLAVNGYNESISGWGREDAELEVRLIKAGIHRQSLKFAAVQYHLFHKEADRSRDTKNIEILNAALASNQFWATNGICKK